MDINIFQQGIEELLKTKLYGVSNNEILKNEFVFNYNVFEIVDNNKNIIKSATFIAKSPYLNILKSKIFNDIVSYFSRNNFKLVIKYKKRDYIIKNLKFQIFNYTLNNKILKNLYLASYTIDDNTNFVGNEKEVTYEVPSNSSLKFNVIYKKATYPECYSDCYNCACAGER